MDEPRPAQGPHLVLWEIEALRRRARELGDGPRVPERIGRLEVDEVRDRHQRRLDAVSRQHQRERRFGVDDRVPRRNVLEAREQAVVFDQSGKRWVELVARAPPSELPGRLDAAGPVGDLDVFGELGHARGVRDRAATLASRPALAVPLLIRGAERVDHLCGQPELGGQRARHLCVVIEHAIDLAAARDGELEPRPEALQRRSAGAEEPQHGESAAVVLARFQRDVVAEPLRLLVGVGVTADVDEQRRVVDRDALLLGQPLAVGEPQGDQALAEHVLHRLAEAEVDAERERRDELGQSHVRAIHRPSVSAARR